MKRRPNKKASELKAENKINKVVKPVLLILAFYILTHPLIEALLLSTAVPFFKYIPSTISNDIVEMALLLWIAISAGRKFRKYIPSSRMIQIETAFVSVYLFYRYFSKSFIFTKSYFFPSFAYLDLMLIYAAHDVVLALFPPKKIAQSLAKKRFYTDQPVIDSADDKYNYDRYASQLADLLSQTNLNSNFVVGINGKWGSGKTSFLNLIDSKFSEEERIIKIHFNAWSSLSPESIVKDFFESVLEAIKPYHSSVAKPIIKYSNKLAEISKSPYSLGFQATTSAVFGFDTIGGLFKQIDQAISQINRRLIIYLDDLDRLNNAELFEVIRLIRNTANFKNSVFILAYDKAYLMQALTTLNPYQPDKYLEKIIQLEIALPQFDENIVRQLLCERLIDTLPAEFTKEYIKELFFGSTERVGKLIDVRRWVKNMRDVTRLVNSVLLNIQGLVGEVNLGDFIKAEIIRLKSPFIYGLLFSETRAYLEAKEWNGNYVYQLIPSDKAESGEIKTKLEEKIYNTKSEHLLSDDDAKNIFEAVRSLFPTWSTPSLMLNFNLSIVHPSKFKRYGFYTIPDEDLSEVEFSKARADSKEAFLGKVEDWVNKGKSTELIRRFEQVYLYDNIFDFENVISGVVCVGRMMYQTEGTVYGFPFSDLVDKLETARTNKIYTTEPTERNLHCFVENIFLNAQDPFRFELAWITHIQNDYQRAQHFTLSALKLSDITLGYLTAHLSNLVVMDNVAFRIFYATRYYEEPTNSALFPKSEQKIPNKAKDCMKAFIKSKNGNGFLDLIIIQNSMDNSFYKLSNAPVDIYDTWENFETYLNSITNSKDSSLQEFKMFYAAFKLRGQNEFIRYQFTSKFGSRLQI